MSLIKCVECRSHVKWVFGPASLAICFCALVVASGCKKAVDDKYPYGKDFVVQTGPMFEFKGVSTNSTKQDVEKLLGFKCGPESKFDDDVFVSCRPSKAGFTFAGIPEKHMEIELVNGHVGKIWFVFDSGSYDELKRMLVEKYMSPSGESSEMLRNGLGVQYENEKDIWRNSGVTMELERYIANRDTSHFEIYSEAYRAAMSKRYREDEKQKKKDM